GPANEDLFVQFQISIHEILAADPRFSDLAWYAGVSSDPDDPGSPNPFDDGANQRWKKWIKLYDANRASVSETLWRLLPLLNESNVAEALGSLGEPALAKLRDWALEGDLHEAKWPDEITRVAAERGFATAREYFCRR